MHSCYCFIGTQRSAISPSAIYHEQKMEDSNKLQALRDMANKLRIHSILATNANKSGYPTSCCSAAEVMSVLFFHTIRHKVMTPRDPANDRFVLSKGHAAPILYAAWAEAGLFPTEDLIKPHQTDSDFEGHPTPRLNFVDVATGSLGQGLSCAAGMAYTGKYLDKADYRVYCLAGDGESAEGPIWEALAFASHYKLDNLVCIFDVNRLSQSEPTALQHDMHAYQKKVEGFGWNACVVDGHDVEALVKSFHSANTVKGKPTCILAKTFKGKGIPDIEDQENWHGRPLGTKADAVVEVIKAKIANLGSHTLCASQPSTDVVAYDLSNMTLSDPPNYEMGQAVTTLAAYGSALTKLGRSSRHVIALDADTKRDTCSYKFQDVFPERFIECFLAEQNMVGVAIGCATRDRNVVFTSALALCISRAHDQLRMAALSQTNANFVGSHVGLSGGDGNTPIALDYMAMFRTIPGSTVFYPSDPVSCERAVEIAANTKGICFICTSLPVVPTIYKCDKSFAIGKAQIVRQSESDQVTVVGCCVTLVEALKAADQLAESNINIRVIDPFTVKPIDAETLINCAKQTGGRFITVEDHCPEGGLGEAVASALAGERDIVLTKLAVTGLPRSGKVDELFEMFGISAGCIIKAVKDILKR